jgi:hypothetical protein
MVDGPARHVDSTARLRQVRQVEGFLEIPVRGRRRHGLLRRGRTDLAAGHPVRQVVHADDRHIDVSPGGVDEVIAANGDEVAVTTVHDHLERGVAELEARCERNGPPVGGVERIDLHVACHAAGAADSRDDGESQGIESALVYCSGEAVDRCADATSGTPDVRHAVGPEVLLNRVFHVRHRNASRIASVTFTGLCTVPPA